MKRKGIKEEEEEEEEGSISTTRGLRLLLFDFSDCSCGDHIVLEEDDLSLIKYDDIVDDRTINT